MGFLFNKKKSKPTKNQLYMKMASEIVDDLGSEQQTYSCNLAMGGGYYHDYVYDGYGLKIVKPDIYHHENTPVYVEYSGERVLDKNTYIPGLWEEVLTELYSKINVILQKKENEKQLLLKQQSILKTLNNIKFTINSADFVIDNTLRVKSYDNISGYYDEHYNGTSYTVYYNEKEVFRAYYSSMNDNKYYCYEPGLWESKLDLYLCKVLLDKEKRKEEQKNNAARENIKRLRNL